MWKKCKKAAKSFGMTTITEREHEFKLQVSRMISFPQVIRDEFFEYWSEPNKGGTRMRFELEKTWDLKRRLQRWARGAKIENKPEGKKEENKTIRYLNERLCDYLKHPSIDNESLAPMYDWFKKNGLIKLNKEQVQIAREVGGEKGKGLAVKFYFDNLFRANLNFSNVLNGRRDIEL